MTSCEVSHDSDVLCPIRKMYGFLALLSQSVSVDQFGLYFMHCLTRFLSLYGRGLHEDAAVWSRRLAETYCNYVLYHFHPGMQRHWHGLAELTWSLPDWVWQHGGAEHALAASIPGPALTIGAHLSMSTMFQDLNFLRRYGNSGAHADRDFNVGNVSPDAEIVCSVLRVSLSFMALHLRLRSRM